MASERQLTIERSGSPRAETSPIQSVADAPRVRVTPARVTRARDDAAAPRVDAATCLLTHDAWVAAAFVEHERARRYGRAYSVVSFGIDDPASLNDLDATAQREFMQSVAACAVQMCRASDTVGWGANDELLVLVPETGAAGARVLAERLGRTIRECVLPRRMKGAARRVSVSAGIASAGVAELAEVVDRATESRTVAKALGRDTVWTYQSPELKTQHVTTTDQPVPLLVIDDDAGDVELLRRNLQQIPDFKFELKHSTSTAAGRDEISAHPVHAVFLDYRLGAESGLDALRLIRTAGFLGPVIAVTGQADEYIVADLIRAGADDYVAKNDLSPRALSRAIKNAENECARRATEARNHELLMELQAAKCSLEGKNQRLTELYKTAHQFVDNVSHEFRTPLTVIKEFTSILRDGLAGPTTSEQQEYLDIVLNRTDDLSTMVDDMLDVSKLEAGVLGVCRRDCAAEEIISNVRTTLQRKALAAKVALQIEVAPQLPALYCDPEKIGRVVINLTVNALKFSKEGGHVGVYIGPGNDDAFVQVRVTDDGPGIPREHRAAIFERFKQLEGSAHASTKGFGLGLSIARELVQLNFGEITLDSVAGKGSTFAFTIPMSRPDSILELYLKRSTGPVSLLRIAALGESSVDMLDDVENFLQHQLRRTDILFSSGSHWFIVAASSHADLGPLIARLERARTEANRNRPARALPELRLEALGTWHGPEQYPELRRRFETERRRADAPPEAGPETP